MMNVLLFGAGQAGKAALRELSEKEYLNVATYCAILDNDAEKQGRIMNGLKVADPQDFVSYPYDLVLVAAGGFGSIREQLVSMGYAKEKIILFECWKMVVYTRHQYIKRYGTDVSVCNRFKRNPYVVYSALFGSNDIVHEPEVTDPDATYVLFTNRSDVKSSIWNVERIKSYRLDDRMMARKLKMSPHEHFKEFQTSIWVDAKFLIKGSMSEYLERYGRSSPILCFPHPMRRCLYDEAAYLISAKIGVKKDLLRQIADYYRDKMPLESGLYDSGCIVRNHHNDLVKKMMEEWYKEINKYSYRDQVSLPYIFNRFSFVPDISDLYIDENQYLHMARFDR